MVNLGVDERSISIFNSLSITTVLQYYSITYSPLQQLIARYKEYDICNARPLSSVPSRRVQHASQPASQPGRAGQVQPDIIGLQQTCLQSHCCGQTLRPPHWPTQRGGAQSGSDWRIIITFLTFWQKAPSERGRYTRKLGASPLNFNQK